MRIGLFVGAVELMRDVAERLRRISAAEEDGFDSYWLPQHFGADMLTVIAMAGMQTSRIELGTAVIPIYPRHPVSLAQQALTAQVAVAGRLTLGIGVSHRSTVEDWLGLSYARPGRYIEEYLSVLRPLLHETGVDFHGRDFQVCGELQFADADMVSCPVVMAALGPRMLEIAGRMADGTVTWMTGPLTLRDYIVPRINAAAEEAGNPVPRICVGMPIAVTDHPERARHALIAFSSTTLPCPATTLCWSARVSTAPAASPLWAMRRRWRTSCTPWLIKAPLISWLPSSLSMAPRPPPLAPVPCCRAWWDGSSGISSASLGGPANMRRSERDNYSLERVPQACQPGKGRVKSSRYNFVIVLTLLTLCSWIPNMIVI